MLAHARRRLNSTLSVPRYYLGGLTKRLFSNPVPLWCQAIAFKGLVTLLPLILLATGVFGLILRQPNPFENVARYLRTFLPPNQSEQLIQLVFELQKASGALTVLASLFFIATIITFLGTVRYVVGQAMGRDRHNLRSIPKGYLFDLRMAAQVGLLFLLSFGLTFAVNTLSVQTSDWASGVGLNADLMERGWAFVTRTLTLVVPWLLSVAMFGQLFYFVPRPRPPKRSALLGATVTALLFEVAKNGFTFYARTFGGFDRYASQDESGPLGGLGGVFGLILVLVFWVYLSGLTLVIGAMVASLHEQRHWPRRSALRRLWRTARPNLKAPAPVALDAARPRGDGASIASAAAPLTTMEALGVQPHQGAPMSSETTEVREAAPES
ncbi:MAG: YihY/virulence factor BrkB family protein [Rhodothermaceae bacterium]|nr:YihY/virulence factor BrkB family protein [Rhodothermaceae bacterium]